MKVAVAGGFGFLGSNIVKRLKEKNYEAIPFSRKNGVDIRVFEQISNFLKKAKTRRWSSYSLERGRKVPTTRSVSGLMLGRRNKLLSLSC